MAMLGVYLFATSILLCLNLVSGGMRDRLTQLYSKEIKEYLQRFGYLSLDVDKELEENPPATIEESQIFLAVKRWQAFNGLIATGYIDDITLQRMQAARCGNKDAGKQKLKANSDETATRRKRHAIQGSVWSIKNLTWKISRYPEELDKHAVLADIRRAFTLWSQVAQLEFSYRPDFTAGQVHIDVRFDIGCHGDNLCHDFDGAFNKLTKKFGNTLAHAFFPQWGGDVHFDEAEEWTTNTRMGCNVFIVAAHEIGHALGLNHSNVPGSLMQPVYPPYRPNQDLHDDDILAIQALYGQRVGAEVLEAGADVKKICSSSYARLDAVTTYNGEVVIFQGKYFSKLLRNGNGVQDGYPVLLSEYFPNIGNRSIDAAVTSSAGNKYIFQGDKYFKYSGHKSPKGYPRLIKEGFIGLPDNMDAAFRSETADGETNTHFFKGDLVWTLQGKKPKEKPLVRKAVDVFQDFPARGIDAIFQAMNGFIYVFRKNLYWRLDPVKGKISPANPPYPREIALWWFGCTIKEP